ncbi:MAG: prepilin-type N-terminal cleavage/methylation domain-containing protein [Betaproteobacteria bacterium]|nr:prepilin-type N-terminal cleavage/methylation domain-containing protein [Betaproteobacteria bacterium]
MDKGFTLIELIITVVVVAILAALATPSYIDYLRRGDIPAGLAELSNQKVKMEQYFMDHRSYEGQACTNINSVTAGKFTFSCVVTPPASFDSGAFKLTATGSGRVDGFVYTIDNKNVKVTVSTGVWNKSSVNCWILKKDGSC